MTRQKSLSNWLLLGSIFFGLNLLCLYVYRAWARCRTSHTGQLLACTGAPDWASEIARWVVGYGHRLRFFDRSCVADSER
jgi:hypothetical protein